MQGAILMINEKLRNFNFVILKEKSPIEPAWQKKIHRWDDPKLQEHISKGGNYGIQSNGSSIIIDGKTYFLVIIDFDKKEFQDKVMPLLPETFTTTSGSPKNCYHLWFACDNNKAFKIHDENMDTLCDILGAGNQVVAPGSKHSSGSIYSVVKDIPFAFVPYAELEAILKPYDKKPKKEIKISNPVVKSFNNDIASKSIGLLSIKQVLEKVGIDTSKNPTGCFKHSSMGGKCLSWNEEVAHCFHCDGSWNKFSLIRDYKNLTDKQTFEWFANETGLTNELKNARKEFVEKNKEFKIFTKQGQVEVFQKEQPIYYDKSKMWWLWDNKSYCWIMTDEVDILNMISNAHGVDVITSKSRTEILNALKQHGRLNSPNPFPKNWIQFKDKIYDIKTGNSFKSTSKYFTTNPIPYKLGDNEECPNIEKLFNDWVGPNYVPTLYEITAYCITQDKFMQRLIALVGAGSNGKGTFASLIQRLIGDSNYSSSELKELCEGRFETASALYKKLLCIIGEVSYDDISNTNQLKKISGEDKLRFEFKGKTAFTDDNTATVLCLTNSLPQTPDKSLGFYRRWLIVDFPNQFQVGKNPINSISDSEMENFARRCFNVLVQIYQTRKFTNEGDYQQREQTYEEKSNPLLKFIDEMCEDVGNEHTPFKDFYNSFNDWLVSKKQRKIDAPSVSKMLRRNSYDTFTTTINGSSVKAVRGIKIKEKLPKLPKMNKSKLDYHERTNLKQGSLGSLSSSLNQITSVFEPQEVQDED